MRKNSGLILIILILTSCKSTEISQLNKDINQANKESVENSPFDSAKSMDTELKRQFKVRRQYLTKLKEIKSEYPNQPIILTESYMFICIGCIADYVSIFTDGILIEYSYDLRLEKYIEKSKELSVEDLLFEGGAQDDINELYEAIKEGKNWNGNPEKYGDENCFDGGQTFYTVYTKNEKIESMYIRCWVPKDYRDN